MRAGKSSQRVEPERRERFAALDLLRGIAALAVLAGHSPQFSPMFGQSYLAVDLFFVLSGFVISHAYEDRLLEGGYFLQFCVARLIRLYPLYFIATLASASFLLAVLLLGNGTNSGSRLTLSVATALLFLPTPGSWSVRPELFFPLVFTAWSLFWELLVNLLYGGGGFRLRGRLLALPILLGGAALIFALFRHGNIGVMHRSEWDWDGFWIGAARALFSFFVGVAVFRRFRRYRPRTIPAWLLAGILVAVLIPGQFSGAAYDAICVLIIFPLLVWFGSNATEGASGRSFGTFLGFLSYPIYLLQVPVGLVLEGFTRHFDRAVPFPIYSVMTIIGAWGVGRFFDAPIRERLQRRFLKRAPKPAAQTAP